MDPICYDTRFNQSDSVVEGICMVDVGSKSIKNRYPLLTLMLCVLLYGLLAIGTTWPLILQPHSRLPLGTEDARTVAFFNAWTIWWNADRLTHLGSGYWDSPIFFPTTNTFALSEPQPMTMAVAPVIWMSGSRVLAYNVYLWFSLLMNGLFTQWLLRFLGVRLAIAIGGGTAMVLLPIVHWQIGVIQLVPLWGILWTWLALAKIFDPKTAPSTLQSVVWRGGELGLGFAAALYASVHHGLFMSLLLIGVAWSIFGRSINVRTFSALSLSVTVAALLTGPILLHVRSMTKRFDFSRPAETVEQLSLKVEDYGSAFGSSLLPFQRTDRSAMWQPSPGVFKLALALAGIAAGVRFRSSRRWTCFIILTGLLSFAFSLGTHLSLLSWEPWQFLCDFVPGFSQVRSAFRFAYFFQIATVLLAAQGVDAILGWSIARFHGKPNERIASVCVASLTLLVGLIAVGDPWPSKLALAVAPDVEPHLDWVNYLEQAPEGVGVLCLPMAGGNHVRDFEITAEWMMLGTYHGRPLVNGYSGFFPPKCLELGEETWAVGLTEQRLDALFREGVRFVVVDQRRFKLDWQDGQELGLVKVKRVVQNSGGVDLFELESARDNTGLPR